jgi:hypothetical protein
MPEITTGHNSNARAKCWHVVSGGVSVVMIALHTDVQHRAGLRGRLDRTTRRHVISDLPDEIAAGATYMTTQATGNFERLQAMPLMNAEQFKAVMEKAKQLKGGYSPPTATIRLPPP